MRKLFGTLGLVSAFLFVLYGWFNPVQGIAANFNDYVGFFSAWVFQSTSVAVFLAMVLTDSFRNTTFFVLLKKVSLVSWFVLMLSLGIAYFTEIYFSANPWYYYLLMYYILAGWPITVLAEMKNVLK